MLVMLTTLIFGTFMDPVQKFLVPPKPGQHGHSEIDDMGRSPSAISQTLYEEIVHPNEEKSVLSDNPSRRPSYILGV